MSRLNSFHKVNTSDKVSLWNLLGVLQNKYFCSKVFDIGKSIATLPTFFLFFYHLIKTPSDDWRKVVKKARLAFSYSTII